MKKVFKKKLLELSDKQHSFTNYLINYQAFGETSTYILVVFGRLNFCEKLQAKINFLRTTNFQTKFNLISVQTDDGPVKTCNLLKKYQLALFVDNQYVESYHSSTAISRIIEDWNFQPAN